jgi:hypothetical protein
MESNECAPFDLAKQLPGIPTFLWPTMTLWPSPMSVLTDFKTMLTRLHADELAKYVRAKLNLAIKLACEGEHERRSGHWESAEGYKCRWEEVMAEVKRLLPVLRNSGVSLFGESHARNGLRAGQANHEKEPRIGRTNVS